MFLKKENNYQSVRFEVQILQHNVT